MMNANMVQEVREAQAAGARALNSLRRAQRHLQKARNWGYVDILGGGLISSLIKHSRLSDAQACIQQAQMDLDTFRRELADVRVPDLEVGSFLTFADFFFDGCLADFLVQNRIGEAIDQLERACRQVEALLYRLRGAED